MLQQNRVTPNRGKMKLAIRTPGMLPHVVRDLSDGELNKHTKFTATIAEARNRLSLFRMLDTNYHELRKLLDELLSATIPEKEPQPPRKTVKIPCGIRVEDYIRGILDSTGEVILSEFACR